MTEDQEKLFIQYVMAHVGIPYRWGGDDPIRGYDCSGFAQEVLTAFGADPKGDQTAQGLYNYFSVHGFRRKRESRYQLPEHPWIGDLAFYGDDDESIVHIALGVGQFLVVEAGGGGSRTKTIDDASRQNAYIRMRPYNHRDDYLISIRPRYPWA